MTVVFLHIDRTGGMALRESLAAQFDYEAIRPVPHHRGTRLQPTSYPLDTQADLEWQNQHYEHDERHELVMGHWDAGILDKIPGEKTVISVLRNPAERAASLWRYICAEPMYGQLGVEARQLGMVDFLYKYRVLWVNAMSTQLAGTRWSANGGAALDAIERIDYVGVTEYLDKFGEKLGAGLGFDLAIDKLNGTKGAAIPAEVYDMVVNEAPHDIYLYKIAKDRCDHAIQQSTLS